MDMNLFILGSKHRGFAKSFDSFCFSAHRWPLDSLGQECFEKLQRRLLASAVEVKEHLKEKTTMRLKAPMGSTDPQSFRQDA